MQQIAQKIDVSYDALSEMRSLAEEVPEGAPVAALMTPPRRQPTNSSSYGSSAQVEKKSPSGSIAEVKK
jgi:hypothetical protein